jgi:hypothetical protein
LWQEDQEKQEQTEGDEMTREQAIEMREVFDAFCDGKEIEQRHNGNITWRPTASPCFGVAGYQIRVALKPMELWVVRVGPVVWGWHESEDAAKHQQTKIPEAEIRLMKDAE